MSIPEKLKELVYRFDSQKDAYTQSGYGEAEVRKEYVDPLFKLLGWDIENERGRPEPLKDVVHEASINVEGAPKAPDYSFRVEGRRKFFVEAKKPSANLRTQSAPAFQLRRYGWSAGLSVSVLTDFEEFAVYDCQVPPEKGDEAATSRVLFFTYDTYIDRWGELTELFGRESVRRGSLERLADSVDTKRDRVEVDELFLEEIERWRRALAYDVVRRNPAVSERELNYAVQLTIDRIVFLRICEDRGIEPYGQLREASATEGVYNNLVGLFHHADQRYNSGLFHFREEADRSEQPDQLTPSLDISDEVLGSIIDGLYYPESPYEFSVLPADILGQVYERFLGSVVHLTSEHEAKIETKPEVRKSGGVYYTPTFIVDHIVRSTLAPLLDGARPDDVAEVGVLDPACGSGHFLVHAFQYLLDWHLQWYVDEGVQYKKYQDRVREGPTGDLVLTTEEKKRILLNNIFGVDIDAQAVEVTRLSLLLKVLEGETEETIDRQLKLFADRALPDLGQNIRCGNSLIDWGYSGGGQFELLRGQNLDEVNPFQWQSEFEEVFSERGGFDVVIGNPPYLSFSGRQAVKLSPQVRDYYARVYETKGWLTSHSLFMERAALLLSRRMVGFVVPAQVGHLDGYESVRKVVLEKMGMREVRYWGEDVFDGVDTPVLTFIGDNEHEGLCQIVALESERCGEVSLDPGEPWLSQPGQELLEKLDADAFYLGKLVQDPGVHTGNCANKLVHDLEDAPDGAVPVLEGKQVHRYHCAEPEKALLLSYKPEEDEYFTIRDEAKYADAEFVIRQTASRPIVGPRRYAVYFRNSLLALYSPDGELRVEYLVALLNSSLICWAYRMLVHESGQESFPQVKVGSIRDLPMKSVDFEKPAEREIHDNLVELVQERIGVEDEFRASKVPDRRQKLRRLRDALDREIDLVVYELYGLSQDEIETVEAMLD